MPFLAWNKRILIDRRKEQFQCHSSPPVSRRCSVRHTPDYSGPRLARYRLSAVEENLGIGGGSNGMAKHLEDVQFACKDDAPFAHQRLSNLLGQLLAARARRAVDLAIDRMKTDEPILQAVDHGRVPRQKMIEVDVVSPIGQSRDKAVRCRLVPGTPIGAIARPAPYTCNIAFHFPERESTRAPSSGDGSLGAEPGKARWMRHRDRDVIRENKRYMCGPGVLGMCVICSLDKNEGPFSIRRGVSLGGMEARAGSSRDLRRRVRISDTLTQDWPRGHSEVADSLPLNRFLG